MTLPTGTLVLIKVLSLLRKNHWYYNLSAAFVSRVNACLPNGCGREPQKVWDANGVLHSQSCGLEFGIHLTEPS